jgi:hypothetical protein
LESNQVNTLDFRTQCDLYAARTQFESLLATGILSSEGSRTPWFEPVITQLLILLSDLLRAADKIGHRCDLKEEILCIDDAMSTKIADVTDLIIRCRNACCHISSGNKLFETNKFQFCKIIGYAPKAFSINGKIIGCDYEDDIALMWGPMRLYLRRNLLRAFEEVAPLFPDPYNYPSPPTNFSNR